MHPRLTDSGEKALQADYKNRLERSRLDLQLRSYEREKLRNRSVIEKEKQLILANLKEIRRTTGVCEKGLALTGPSDDVYQMSVHSLKRLSEKRLMRWKVVEKELQRFLKAKAVSMDDIPSGSVRVKKIAWDDDKKKSKKMPGSAGNRMGGDVEDEKLAVHHGGHSSGAAGDSQEIPMTRSEEKLKRVSSGLSTKSDRSSGRQRHHSECIVRPHTAAQYQTSSPPKQWRRPKSAFSPTKQQTGIVVTKDAVYLAARAITSKRMLRSTLDPPTVNNFVGGISSYSSIDSLDDRDAEIVERRQSEIRGYTGTGSSNSEEGLSDRTCKSLTKQVSMSSMLDQLNEEAHPIFQSAVRSASTHSSKHSKSCSLTRSRSSLRHTDDSSNTTRFQDSDDEASGDSRLGEDDRRRRFSEFPHMHETDTVKETLTIANCFSKRARTYALVSLVTKNSPDKREQLRQDRLRAVKARLALLSKAASQFNLLESYSHTHN